MLRYRLLQLLTDTLALFIFIKDLHDAHINIVATNQQLVIHNVLLFSNHSMTDCQLCNQKKEKKENKKKKIKEHNGGREESRRRTKRKKSEYLHTR